MLSVSPQEYQRLLTVTEELRERVAYYRSELGFARNRDTEANLMKSLKLTRSEARLVNALYAAHRLMSREHLHVAYEDIGLCEDPKVVDVLMCRIRQKLGHPCIENVWGMGFRLTEPGRLKVKLALENAEVR